MSETERPGGSILIVDDEPANLSLLSDLLSGRGFKVRAVLNGARALAAAQASPPDLILLDVMMPGMNGYEVCEKLKADERTRNIPVLFLSALSDTANKVKAFAAGGLDYITKPFQVEEVLARVETQMTLRRLRRELEAANAELTRHIDDIQARNAELDAFARNVAHDLRNPLSVLLGYAELLAEGDRKVDDAVRREWVDDILRLGRQMDEIIHALLFLAEVRGTQLNRTPLDMAALVGDALAQLKGQIEASAAEVSLPDATEWPVAWGYRPWIVRVWVNYLSNAIKYGGRPPRIVLGGELEASGAMARFWVRDNGPGIAAEDQDRLFVEFSRLPRAGVSGHGLGLSIVRRIVEKLGGRAGVESRPGEGSTFYFTLPATG
jgi:two-component system sensor histidine kinase/response regulator